MGDRFSGQHGRDSVFQIMNLSLRAGDAGGNIAVVDAAMVFQISGGIEDGGFGRDAGVGAIFKGVVGIAQRGAGKSELGHVFFDGAFVFVGIGIHKIKSDVAALEFFRDAGQFRGIAIGDGAIGADENEDLHFGGECERPEEQKRREDPHSSSLFQLHGQ